jgi:hypothetical protein
MSDHAGGNADRDAFFAALGRVFQEYRHVSGGYAICDLTRLAGMVGGDLENQVGISRPESGRIVTEFSDEIPNPIARELGDECIAIVPDHTTDPPSWTCIIYLTS